ncbi:hypothetical protein [Nonomuraea basaltis]|uniref:hypothetical protein n=1 Tax=Nonomuraea basaltis TaxID=2495887 RepID=UPI00110C679D|nr:hypothetical protein [Nonomuraea basaltis]TMS00170.1 hypothetical protein EJK15_03605 [Nonomuraea basaltis]
MNDLLVIVPSRGRPHNIADLYVAWSETAHRDAGLLVAVDDDDPALPEYQRVCSLIGVELEVGPRLRLTGTLNKVATERAPHHKAIAFMGDDHRPRTIGWDTQLLAELNRLGTGIVYGNDLLQGEKMATAVAITSDIVAALGYMAPPSMVHLCLDLVWVEWGRSIARLTYLPGTVIEHMHPAAGKAANDAGYEEANSPHQTAADHAAYHAYRNGPQFAADVEKLKALL